MTTDNHAGAQQQDGQQQDGARARPRGPWRTVDVVVVGVLAVAVGLLEWVWNVAQPTITAPFSATPLTALTVGVWLLPGPLGMLVVRRPGAAVLTSTLAAVVAALLGSSWGWAVVYYGFLQGLAPELVFAATRYRRFGLPVALLAGASAGVAVTALDLLVYFPSVSAGFGVVYLGCAVLSGVVVAGLGAWALTRALARSGALAAFASGRERGAV